MPVQAIDNTNLVNYCNTGCSITGFTPALSYAVAGANVTITDATVVPAGDTFKKVHVRLIDDFGKEVRGVISAAAGNVVLSSATLNTSKPLKLQATIITTNGIVADGSSMNIGAAGSFSSFDVQINAQA